MTLEMADVEPREKTTPAKSDTAVDAIATHSVLIAHRTNSVLPNSVSQFSSVGSRTTKGDRRGL